MTTAQERAALMSKIGLDAQNKASLGRLLACGNIGQATEISDGRMEATIRINPDELVWDPSILVMPHGGDIELEIINDDLSTHCALLPSNGDRQFIWLVNHSFQLTGDAARTDPVCHLSPDHGIVAEVVQAANEGTRPGDELLIPVHIECADCQEWLRGQRSQDSSASTTAMMTSAMPLRRSERMRMR